MLLSSSFVIRLLRLCLLARSVKTHAFVAGSNVIFAKLSAVPKEIRDHRQPFDGTLSRSKTVLVPMMTKAPETDDEEKDEMSHCSSKSGAGEPTTAWSPSPAAKKTGRQGPPSSRVAELIKERNGYTVVNIDPDPESWRKAVGAQTESAPLFPQCADERLVAVVQVVLLQRLESLVCVICLCRSTLTSAVGIRKKQKASTFIIFLLVHTALSRRRKRRPRDSRHSVSFPVSISCNFRGRRRGAHGR